MENSHARSSLLQNLVHFLFALSTSTSDVYHSERLELLRFSFKKGNQSMNRMSTLSLVGAMMIVVVCSAGCGLSSSDTDNTPASVPTKTADPSASNSGDAELDEIKVELAKLSPEDAA